MHTPRARCDRPGRRKAASQFCSADADAWPRICGCRWSQTKSSAGDVHVELWSDTRVVVQRAQRQTEVVTVIVELAGKSSAGSPLSRGRALHRGQRVWIPAVALRTPRIWRRPRC